MTDRVNILDLAPADAQTRLSAFAEAQGEPSYRGRQAARRLWTAPVAGFDQMTELPARLRALLTEHFDIPRLTLAARQQSTDGTEKFLFRLADGEGIETVAIPEGRRLTLCISSQAGCALQCAFCATGAMGFARNLRAWEIAGQVRELALLDPPLRATNVVFMGMGEPLMNWDQVRRGAHRAERPGGTRHRRAAHHRLDGRHPAGHRGAGRSAGAIPARDLDSRPHRCPSARAHADQHQIPAGRCDRRRQCVHAACHIRVRAARRRQ